MSHIPYIEANKDRFLNELLDLLKIPSVSADSKFTADVARTAEFVAERLKAAGADNVEICPTQLFENYEDKTIFNIPILENTDEK